MRRMRASATRFPLPSFAETALSVAVFERVQALIEGRPPPPFVASGVVEALFGALERSGMRRINCDKCGNEWMTRGAVDTCPACVEKAES